MHEAAGPKGDRGDPGAQGDRGARGKQGLPWGIRYAMVFLFTLSVLLAALNLLWTSHEVHASQAQQQAAGVALERNLCKTFAVLAALKPPPGDPKTNPSRAYLQGQHDALVQLGADVGCK